MNPLELDLESKIPRVGWGGGHAVALSVRGAVLGGPAAAWIAGPCAVESEAQIEAVARGLARLGVRFFRAGAFKPRTSPYSFQGLRDDGLLLLAAAARRHGLVTVTEATSLANLGRVAEAADIVQIGARNMYNYELLREVGRIGKPVLLKRGLSATLEEWLLAAEYVAAGGSDAIVLCERGVRGIERNTRFTLDLASVPLVQTVCRLPVVVDVSHAAGRRDLLVPLARAALAVGSAGVMVEVHPNPAAALSDAEQQLSLEGFAALQREVVQGLRAAASLTCYPLRKEERLHAVERCLQLR